ncbi:MAG: bifunctional phosphoglucose/phosphomannose isomerase [Candidatus Omnitrophota bacterium]
MRALSSATINKLDKSGMLELLLDFPLQFGIARELASKTGIIFSKRDFSSIVFAGLGGSAIGADLVRSYLYFESNLPMQVVREYDLPAYVGSSTLVFISSYSGNTEETLSAYSQARKKGSSIIAVSSNGALKENCLRDGVTFIEIPKGLPPRCSLGYLSIIPLCLLAKLGLIKDASSSLDKTVSALEDLRSRKLNPAIGAKDNIAKYVAGRLVNKFPIIYSASVHFDTVATRMRCQLNENSKSLASSHVFPEMNHNEIVGWEHPARLFKNLAVVMLRDKGAHPRVNKRMDITREIICKENPDIIEIYSEGEDLLARIFSLIYIGDFVSFYLAVLYGIDPTPVERVTYLKKKLAED